MTTAFSNEHSTAPASIVQLRTLLPQLRDSDIALRNRAYASAPCLLSNGRVLVWQDSPSFATTGELFCKLAGMPFVIAVDSLSSLEPRLASVESFAPNEACTALVEHALAPLLALIERLAGMAVECNEYRRTGTGHPADGNEPAVRIGFVMAPNKHLAAVRGWMCALPQTWRSIDFTRTPALPSQRHLGVPAALIVQLGNCRLTMAQLRNLRVGAALRVTPRLTRGCDDLPVLLTDISRRFSSRARLCGDNIILDTIVNTHIETPPSATALASPPDSTDPLMELECDVNFELGSVRMTVAEIGKLRSGQALRLGARLQEQPVRIMVSGRLIARGELAAVGDELVVVVTDTTRLAHV